MSRDRAVSDVLGFVIVFSLVAATVGIVSVSGIGILQDARNAEQLNNAERAFDVLADNMADIHQEGAPSRSTEIKLDNARLEVRDPIEINVTGVNPTGTNPSVSYSSTPIMYEGRSDTAIVYEGGAVFRDAPQGGVVSEQPPFRFSDGEVIIPIIQTQQMGNTTSISGGTVRVRAERAVREPLPEFVQREADYDALIVNITSPRYRLWRRYLEDDADATCKITRPETVQCRIDDPKRLAVTRTLINFEFET
ncbi:DUF7289 family protein [Halorientalis regularis]|jgi:hypothetical protein|uniref:Uncharacterized protein n=1 Tax=Halorientalis regularis TaxID=660518 RepID=A0A1G7PNI9_9EURY|nr:hypothetical protein [Halorientalis regularis]SDF87229.1 hypothetical protein SAMN05216218_110189 [Halorientalis regularis]